MILVTGAAGFIGFHTAKKLLEQNEKVIGLDNFNDYYEVSLKEARWNILTAHKNFIPIKADITDFNALNELCKKHKPFKIIHLAAQAGVRYSIENPRAYLDSNLIGFFNILEISRIFKLEHLIFASSSSVYGANAKTPFSTEDKAAEPVSFYAATKGANELMAHSYAHIYKIPMTGLRFFTVYGQWGRPDMSPMLFAKAIMEEKSLKIFNHGDMERDFTYVDDIVEGILKTSDKIPSFFKIYNIGNSKPVNLLKYIETLEDCLGKQAKKEYLPMQQGDVPKTWADVGDLIKDTGYCPKTSLKDGLQHFALWFKDYYGYK